MELKKKETRPAHIFTPQHESARLNHIPCSGADHGADARPHLSGRMKQRPKPPAVPSERTATVRQEIIALLGGRFLSPREISAEVGISEKEVYEHLYHIEKTMNSREGALLREPPSCLKCGFVYKKRERLTKPGKCPVCRAEHITDPLFSIKYSSE